MSTVLYVSNLPPSVTADALAALNPRVPTQVP